MVNGSTRRRAGRRSRQVVHFANHPRHIEYRRRRIALRAEHPVPAAMGMVLAYVVFAGKRMFVVPRALVHRGTSWAATLSVVHAGSHGSLAFDYGPNNSTKRGRVRT